MIEMKVDKIERVLDIYTKLISSYLVKKVEDANNYGTNEKSIQSDFEDISAFECRC